MRFIALMFACSAPALCAAGASETDWNGAWLGLFAGYSDASEAWDNGAAPEISPEGPFVGGFAGHAWTAGPLVLGIEVDLSFPDLSDGEDCAAPPGECTLDVQVMSSLRGRAGLALGQVLLYGTAGPAAGFIQAESSGGGSDSLTLGGWTAGAGAEIQTSSGLRLGIEYRHSDFGESTVQFSGGPQGAVDLQTDEVRLRLSIALD